ncbi:MAG: hypothetical protein QNJ56_11535 [Gammaproteobacteria bacterium]|nr:hypothetical protein [Gammaproteobacteria bacterium]
MNPLARIPQRYHSALREKAIKRAQTRIILAGRTPQDFTSEDLEIVVQEEEDKIKTEIKEKGLLAILALLGLSWFG